MPDDFRTSASVNIYKNKDHKLDSNNYRGIVLTATGNNLSSLLPNKTGEQIFY